MARNPEEQVERQLLPVAERGHATLRIEGPDDALRVPLDAELLEPLEQHGGGRRRRRNRLGHGHHERDLGRLAQPASHELVVQQQGGLARRGHALVRGGGDPDDDAAAREPVERLPRGDGTLHRVELVAGLSQARRLLGSQVGAERDNENLGLERAGRGLDSLRGGVDGQDVGLHEPDARAGEVPIEVPHLIWLLPSEKHVELREAEHEAVGSIDQHDVGVAAELIGESAGDLQAPESGTQHHDACHRLASVRSISRIPFIVRRLALARNTGHGMPAALASVG